MSVYVEPHAREIRWPFTDSDPRGLKEMCAYGAKAYDEKRCDCVEFSVFFNEVQEVNRIMAENYPHVRYYFK